MIKRGNLILLLLALVLALGTTLVVMRQISAFKQQNTPKASLKSVVVVKLAVSPHQPVTTDDVQLEQVPAGSLQPGAATQLSQVVGQYTRTTWIVGQQVVAGMYGDGKSVAFTASIPPGERAFTIADSPVIGVDHLISPGDHVDVLVLAGSNSRLPGGQKSTTVQDLLVLFVDQLQPAANPGGPKSQSSGGDTITFAVTPQQADQLAQLESEGQIHLLLRGSSN